jgi:hypothetical protein
MFVKGSRYETVEDCERTDDQGHILRYKAVRFIPETDAQFSHLLSQGERLDHLAYRYYRDPERFWRVCDANGAMWPDDLVADAGQRILIPL